MPVDPSLHPRIVIISGFHMLRESLAHALSQRSRFQVIDSCSSLDTGAASVRRLGPEVTLVDVSPPANLEALRELAKGNQTRIVAFSAVPLDPSVVQWRDGSVTQFVRHDATLHELLLVVEWAAGAIGQAESNGTDVLTPREREILVLLERGRANKEIAATLNIEVPTVKNHVHRIREKLHLHRRSEVAARPRG